MDNPYFEGMFRQIYPTELELSKANSTDTEAPGLDLHLSNSNGFRSVKMYDKRNDFDSDNVNFQILDDDVPRSHSYGVYISQLIRFARVSSHLHMHFSNYLLNKSVYSFRYASNGVVL